MDVYLCIRLIQKLILPLHKIFSLQVLGIASSRLAKNNTAATYAVEHRNLLLHVLEAYAFTVDSQKCRRQGRYTRLGRASWRSLGQC